MRLYSIHYIDHEGKHCGYQRAQAAEYAIRLFFRRFAPTNVKSVTHITCNDMTADQELAFNLMVKE